MKLPQDQHAALRQQVRVQDLPRRQRRQGVVEGGQAEVWMFDLDARPGGVQLLGHLADPPAHAGGGGRKREGIEAGGLGVAGPILQHRPRGQRPGEVRARGQHTQVIGVRQAEVDQHVVRPDARLEEDEQAVLGRLRRRDVAGQVGGEAAVHLVGGAEPPPVFSAERHPVGVPMGLHRGEQVLVHLGEAGAHLRREQRVEVDHPGVPGLLDDVAAVAIGPDAGV